jgi:hypothetical protein
MKLFAIIFALGTIQTIAGNLWTVTDAGAGWSRDLLLLQSGDSFKSSEHGPGTTPTYDGLRSQRKLVQSEALRWPVTVTLRPLTTG